jgi:hypothetical protein
MLQWSLGGEAPRGSGRNRENPGAGGLRKVRM